MYKIEPHNKFTINIRRWFLASAVIITTGAKAFVPLIGFLLPYIAALLATGAIFSPTIIRSFKSPLPIMPTPIPEPIPIRKFFPGFTPQGSVPKATISPAQPDDGRNNKPQPVSTCRYPKLPETSAKIRDGNIKNYKILLDSLIVKELRSSLERPLSDVAKWQRDAGIPLKIVGKPILGAYQVKFDTPMTAVELSYVIKRMFLADAPKPENFAGPRARCRYDFIEPNWVATPNSPLSAKLNSPNDFFFPNQWSIQKDPLNNKFGSDFTGAWQTVKDWIETVPDRKLKPLTISIVDDGIVNTDAKNANGTPRFFSDVKYDSAFSFDTNFDEEGDGSPIISYEKPFCPEKKQICHGVMVASVMSATSNNSIGTAGALGIGMNYGEKNVYKTQMIAVEIKGSYMISHSLLIATGHAPAGHLVKRNSEGVPLIAGDNYLPVPSRVINMSFGGNYPCSVLEQRTINLIHNNTKDSIVMIAASGNPGQLGRSRGSMASCNGVIAVVSHDRQGEPPLDAPSGISPEDHFDQALSAPGEGIVYRNEYAQYQLINGTSFAAPHIAAAAAMLLAVRPELTWEEVKKILINTGSEPSAGSRRIWKALDMKAAVIFAISKAKIVNPPFPYDSYPSDNPMD